MKKKPFINASSSASTARFKNLAYVNVVTMHCLSCEYVTYCQNLIFSRSLAAVLSRFFWNRDLLFSALLVKIKWCDSTRPLPPEKYFSFGALLFTVVLISRADIMQTTVHWQNTIAFMYSHNFHKSKSVRKRSSFGSLFQLTYTRGGKKSLVIECPLSAKIFHTIGWKACNYRHPTINLY